MADQNQKTLRERRSGGHQSGTDRVSYRVKDIPTRAVSVGVVAKPEGRYVNCQFCIAGLILNCARASKTRTGLSGGGV
jgi:hypothetical protein